MHKAIIIGVGPDRGLGALTHVVGDDENDVWPLWLRLSERSGIRTYGQSDAAGRSVPQNCSSRVFCHHRLTLLLETLARPKSQRPR